MTVSHKNVTGQQVTLARRNERFPTGGILDVRELRPCLTDGEVWVEPQEVHDRGHENAAVGEVGDGDIVLQRKCGFYEFRLSGSASPVIGLRIALKNNVPFPREAACSFGN